MQTPLGRKKVKVTGWRMKGSIVQNEADKQGFIKHHGNWGLYPRNNGS